MKTSFFNYGKFLISISFFAAVMFTNSFAACAANINVGGKGMTAVGTMTGLSDNVSDSSSAVSRAGISTMIAAASSANTVVFDNCTMVTGVKNAGTVDNNWIYNLEPVTNTLGVLRTTEGAPGLFFPSNGNYSVDASFSITLDDGYFYQPDKNFMMTAQIKHVDLDNQQALISEYLTSEMRTHAMWYQSWGKVWTYNTSFTFEVTSQNPRYATIYLGGSMNNHTEVAQRFKDQAVSYTDSDMLNAFVPNAVANSGKCRFVVTKLN